MLIHSDQLLGFCLELKLSPNFSLDTPGFCRTGSAAGQAGKESSEGKLESQGEMDKEGSGHMSILILLFYLIIAK